MSDKTDIIEYLNQKGIKYSSQGTEVILHCPQCHKEKLYINTKTLLYHCFVCEAERPTSLYSGGHISKLQEEWGDIIPISSPTISLPKEEKDFTGLVKRYSYNLFDKNGKLGLKYLFSRGFNEEDIKRFNFGFVEMKEESWISIPSYEDGIPKLIKYRKITNNTDAKKYEREFGSNSILFNGDVINKYNEIILVEGEFECCTMLKYGYENTVGLTGGAGTFLPAFYDKLYLTEKIILILNPDNAGQKAAQNVFTKRLGTGRCWNVLLPEGEDINSFFLKYNKEDFEKFLDKKYQFKIEGISSLSEALMSMYSKEKLETYSLPWKSINRLLGGGIEKKQLVTLGGQAGIGKTSNVLQIAYYFATVHSMPSLVTCLEMSEIKLATKIVQLHNDLDYQEITPNHAMVYARDLEDVPIYFAYSPGITPEIYYNTVKEARNRYGCELFIFDNLQLLVRSGEESDIGKVTKMFKNIAMGLDVIMLMVSQPRKLNSEREPTYDDLKGSSAISQDSDIVLLIHRKRKKDSRGFDAFESQTTVIVDKSRFSSGGRETLEFLGSKSRFVEK